VDEYSKPVGVLTRASFISHHSDHDDGDEEEVIESRKSGPVPACGRLGQEVHGGSYIAAVFARDDGKNSYLHSVAAEA